MVVSDNNSVRVALRIRPRNEREEAEHTEICTSVVAGRPQITIGGKKSFTYDYVFDQIVEQDSIYDACVCELVEGTFDGYNATVLAYGQTGSGKTYTMGTSVDGKDQNTGIIPRAAAHIFHRIDSLKAVARENGMIEPQFEIIVQFIELYNEEIIDLLAEERRSTTIKIHEDPTKGEIVLKGVTSIQINSANEILDALQNGAINRTTAATNMNQQSSRSHAIFTVQIKQQRMVTVDSEDALNLSISGNMAPLTEVEMLMAKFHFVDLAGSERLKRTGATGDRAKEGISINSGLLALGNVISALGGGAGRVQHVPYRDSKLTRLLQDSLGGNSRTLMIACASPCDRDFVETLNTLNYANRAKNIKNKVVANQDKSSKLIGELISRIEMLEAELSVYRQGKKLAEENGQELISDKYLNNVSLEDEVNRLRVRLHDMDEAYNVLEQRCTTLSEQLELNKLHLTGESVMKTASDDSEKRSSTSSAIRGYIERIEDLESKLNEALSGRHCSTTSDSEISERNAYLESEMAYLTRLNEKLRGTITRLQQRLHMVLEDKENMKTMYEEFATQKQVEIGSISNKMNVLEEENRKLASSMGHSNTRQKISYIDGLRQRVAALEKENTSLRAMLDKNGKSAPATERVLRSTAKFDQPSSSVITRALSGTVASRERSRKRTTESHGEKHVRSTSVESNKPVTPNRPVLRSRSNMTRRH